MSQRNEKLEQLVSNLVPIGRLNSHHVKELLNQAHVVELKKGRFLFKQGDKDPYSFYLLDGELEMYHENQLAQKIQGGTDAAKYALAQLQPRQLSAKARASARVLRFERSVLDRLITLEEQSTTGGEVEVGELDTEESVDWMSRMLQSELFTRVPAANIQRIFSLMEEKPFHPGDEVIRQGEPGDYYYVIHKGRCEVTRKTSNAAKEVKLAELREGDAFGEEALVSDATRNATVRMLTEGVLMRLTKQDFVELIKKPALRSVDFEQGQALVKEGGIWLDVRFPEEHKETPVAGSMNVPLSLLRTQLPKLERTRPYVVFCDTGSRSSAAAFILTESGHDARYLSGGLLKSPLGRLVARAARTPEQAPQAAPVPTNRSNPAAAPTETTVDSAAGEALNPEKGTDALEADVKAAALKAELVRANSKLEEAVRLKEQSELARAAAERAARERLKSERERLESQVSKATKALADAQQTQQAAEAARRAAEQDVEGKFARERKQIEADATQAKNALAEARRMKEEAEATKQKVETELQKTLADKREKLEADAAKAAEALAAAERIKEELELAKKSAEAELKARLQTEREKLENETARANQALAEAQRLKEETEAAKRRAEADAEKRRREEEERVQNLKSDMEARLREEQERLAAQYAQNAEELAAANRVREEAERQALEERKRLEAEAAEARKRLDEAHRIQERVEHSQRRAEQEAEKRSKETEAREQALREELDAKLREERSKLEAQFAKNAQVLQEAQKEKASAEAARAAATKEAEQIIEEYKAAHQKQREEEEARLRAEREKLESEAKQIRATLQEAKQAKAAAELTQRAAEEQADRLRGAQVVSTAQGTDVGRLESEMALVETSLRQAYKELEAAERAELQAAAAQRQNETRLEQNHEELGKMHEQLAEELEQWRYEQERMDSMRATDVVTQQQADHMDRIRKRAQDAKRHADESVEDLLADVASQLGKEQ